MSAQAQPDWFSSNAPPAPSTTGGDDWFSSNAPSAQNDKTGNAGTLQKPMVTPLPGESFEDTIKRAIAMAKNVTPKQLADAQSGAIKQIPTVLGTAALAGPAVLTAGAIAPAAASEAAGGGILGAAAGGATAGAGTSLLTQPTQGQNPFSEEGVKQVARDTVAGGLTGAVFGAGGKLASKALTPFTDASGQFRVPSFSHAGQAFQDVSSVVADHPIEITDPLAQSVLQVKQFAQNGSNMPSPVSKFLERITDPDLPPLTYKDARQFYTNINKLTAADKMATNPQMKMYIGQLASDLGDSIEDVAARGGKQQVFVDAMKEWHNASQVDAAKEAIKDNAVNAIVKGAGIGAAGALAGHYVKNALSQP